MCDIYVQTLKIQQEEFSKQKFHYNWFAYLCLTKFPQHCLDAMTAAVMNTNYVVLYLLFAVKKWLK